MQVCRFLAISLILFGCSQDNLRSGQTFSKLSESFSESNYIDLPFSQIESLRLPLNINDIDILYASSDYPSSKNILIIRQPHADLEGQETLMNLVSSILKRNQWLTSSAIFLVESAESKQKVGIELAMDTHGELTDDESEFLLRSFLIPGNIVSICKNDFPINIIGTENMIINDISVAANLGEDIDDDLGEMSFVCRNKSIATTIRDIVGGDRHIILFEGGHLSGIKQNRFFDLLATIKKNYRNDDFVRRVVSECENLGIIEYLKKFHIGYTLIVPQYRNQGWSNKSSETRTYQKLYAAQRSGNYVEYIAGIVNNADSISNKIESSMWEKKLDAAGVTVRPSPNLAALALSLKQDRRDRNPGDSSKRESLIGSIIKDMNRGAKSEGKSAESIRKILKGGWEAAAGFFNRLRRASGSSATIRRGRVVTADLPSNRRAVLRKRSSGNKPTLEIQQFDKQGKLVNPVEKFRFID